MTLYANDYRVNTWDLNCTEIGPVLEADACRKDPAVRTPGRYDFLPTLIINITLRKASPFPETVGAGGAYEQAYSMGDLGSDTLGAATDGSGSMTLQSAGETYTITQSSWGDDASDGDVPSFYVGGAGDNYGDVYDSFSNSKTQAVWSSVEVAGIFERLGTDADTWQARMQKLNGSRLLGRFSPSAGLRLRGQPPVGW